MLENLKEIVYKGNIALKTNKLIIATWGNVSGIDRTKGLIVIKPSGVSYEEMKAEHMVVVDLDGNVVEGNFKPSSDTKTHIEIYKAFKDVGGIVHTHSTYATSFAQSNRPIIPLGTTHSDYFYGEVPITRGITQEETMDYEANTGKVIVETFRNNNINENFVPAVLVNEHGPFTWGKTPEEAVYHSVVLEEVAKMAINTLSLNKEARISQHILDKHYNRKHGKNSYYGQ